jgi:multidrug efflux pump
MQEVMGKLFQEFALTLAFSIIISAVVSLTLTPMLCAKILSSQQVSSQNKFMLGLERALENLKAKYSNSLQVVLQHQTLTMYVVITTIIFATLLFISMPTGFFPQQDNGLLRGVVIFPADSSFTKISQKQQL